MWGLTRSSTNLSGPREFGTGIFNRPFAFPFHAPHNYSFYKEKLFFFTRGVPFRVRVRLSRRRNEDEDSPHKLYTLVTWVPVEEFHGTYEFKTDPITLRGKHNFSTYFWMGNVLCCPNRVFSRYSQVFKPTTLTMRNSYFWLFDFWARVGGIFVVLWNITRTVGMVDKMKKMKTTDAFSDLAVHQSTRIFCLIRSCHVV